MTYYISKYALSSGIRPAKTGADLTDSGKYLSEGWGSLLKVGLDAHATQAEAIAAAEAMRVKKIASLKKQMAKLEKLSFAAPTP